mgnify:CR=1 FL=1
MRKNNTEKWYRREIKKDEKEIATHKKSFIKEIQKIPRKDLIKRINKPNNINKWKTILEKVKNFFHS